MTEKPRVKIKFLGIPRIFCQKEELLRGPIPQFMAQTSYLPTRAPVNQWGRGLIQMHLDTEAYMARCPPHLLQTALVTLQA